MGKRTIVLLVMCLAWALAPGYGVAQDGDTLDGEADQVVVILDRAITEPMSAEMVAGLAVSSSRNNGSAQFETTSPIVGQWRDFNSNLIAYRQTAKGKANGHDLVDGRVQRATEVVARSDEAGSSYLYPAYATGFTCPTPAYCFPAENREVRVVVDFGPNTQQQQKGVITAYCPTTPQVQLCPSWVNGGL